MVLYTIDIPCNTEPMPATKLIHIKESHGDGFIEIVIWKIPNPLLPSEHSFKYSLVYIVDGKRVVGYDNERGKGDHKHLNDEELEYDFVSPAQLMSDFMADIEGVIDGK
ncbi:toxin-antitoxin system TumE family protein [Leucothrix pacifica]|nr:DUF6516 family protein [Leucothrix pacifica]